MKSFVILFFVLILAVCSCNSEQQKNIEIPDNVIPFDSMAGLLADIHLVESGIALLQTDTASALLRPYYYSILHKWNTDRDRFERSMAFYGSRVELLDSIYGQTIMLLIKQQSQGVGTIHEHKPEDGPIHGKALGVKS
jgi:hypothetical protein